MKIVYNPILLKEEQIGEWYFKIWHHDYWVKYWGWNVDHNFTIERKLKNGHWWGLEDRSMGYPTQEIIDAFFKNRDIRFNKWLEKQSEKRGDLI